ncbi:MAG TPA: alpha/beta hydrolase [Myxococcota bacterium]|jgi:pimeloyl-ACP methyl ester carboxylesterase|nr:alpha/beta hydrolase [Myxococcota bacterium]
MDEAHAAASEGDARTGEASVHWRRDGAGPAIVFLHGFPLSGRTWEAVVARLRDRFTCYAPDLIGLGLSHSTAADDYASQGQARAIQAALRQLRVDSYALVGNDTGGWIARELALIDAPRVSRLVLTNTEIPFHRPPWIPMYQALAHVPGFGVVVRQLLRARAWRRSPLVFGGCFQDLGLLDGEFHARFVEPLIASDARIQGALAFLRRMKFARLDEFDRLHRELALPTLFVWGANDPTFPVAKARAMIGRFPNVAGFHEVANAKLFVYEERPQEVAGLIAGFLASSPA